MAKDVKAMSEDMILECAMKEVARHGSKLVKMRKLNHEADFYLRYILAHNEDKEEYIVWTYNVQFDGLSGGQYFGHHAFYNTTKQEAHDKALAFFENK